jgi:hypothetical protein
MIAPEDWLIQPEETELRGFWIDLGSRMEKDAHWQRIEWLTTEHLTELAWAANGRDVLYRDPLDGRLWEKAFDHSHLHDGGPPRLTQLSPATAATRYGVTF